MRWVVLVGAHFFLVLSGFMGFLSSAKGYSLIIILQTVFGLFSVSFVLYGFKNFKNYILNIDIVIVAFLALCLVLDGITRWYFDFRVIGYLVSIFNW